MTGLNNRTPHECGELSFGAFVTSPVRYVRMTLQKQARLKFVRDLTNKVKKVKIVMPGNFSFAAIRLPARPVYLSLPTQAFALFGEGGKRLFVTNTMKPEEGAMS